MSLPYPGLLYRGLILLRLSKNHFLRVDIVWNKTFTAILLRKITLFQNRSKKVDLGLHPYPTPVPVMLGI